MNESLENLPSVWFRPKITFLQIERIFQEAKEIIRIASGFFTIKGWNLIRESTRGKQVLILVGITEPSEGEARKLLIQEIISDLATGVEQNRRQAVEDLIERIRQGEFQMVDARAIDHHGKFYIADDNVVVFSSANTTGKGFINQAESGILVPDPTHAIAMVEEFNRYWVQAKDLTQELLAALERWLELASPWDIYLKTLLALENLKPLRRKYKTPTAYQRSMIAQALDHIRAHGGEFLVASTGLGKTVIGTHVALQLFEAEEITNIMIIGPKPVQSSWEAEMRMAGLPCDYFVHQTLDKESPKDDRKLEIFNSIVRESISEQWLIIIDESHYFRNRINTYGEERQSFIRLLSLIKNNKCLVLLLTGSPYSTEVDNVNNQLLLLPPTTTLETNVEQRVDNYNVWHINNTEEFIRLPVASQLTTPYVAKYYGQTDRLGTFVLYGEEKRYIPQVTLHRVDYHLPFEREVTEAILNGYFESSEVSWNTIETQAKISWDSSSRALREIIERIINTPGGTNAYKVKFKIPQVERQRVLQPILERLESLKYTEDLKLLALSRIIADYAKQGVKVVVFSERLATAVYLQQGLKFLVSDLRTFCTVERTKQGAYAQKIESKIFTAINKFAPIANNIEGLERESTYDVFITTDAYGVGINLQDASVVVNYDLAWTPINPTQRAGRVLRLWMLPRTVEIYTFVPVLTIESSLKYESIAYGRRWLNLSERHAQSQKLVDLPILPTETRQEIYMPDVASTVSVTSGHLDIKAFEDLDVSPYFQHSSKLQENREYALNIPDDIISVKSYSGRQVLIYVLMKHKGKYYWSVYDADARSLLKVTPVQLLELIQCEAETERALVDAHLIEDLSAQCIETWCRSNQVNPNEVLRICTLYLKPNQKRQATS